MIKIWRREFGEEETYLLDKDIEQVFVYSNFLEVVTRDEHANGSKHEIISLTKLDYFGFDDSDNVIIMEPVRSKQ